MRVSNALVTYDDLLLMPLTAIGTPAVGPRVATKQFIINNYYVDETASPFAGYSSNRCPPYQTIISKDCRMVGTAVEQGTSPQTGYIVQNCQTASTVSVTFGNATIRPVQDVFISNSLFGGCWQIIGPTSGPIQSPNIVNDGEYATCIECLNSFPLQLTATPNCTGGNIGNVVANGFAGGVAPYLYIAIGPDPTSVAIDLINGTTPLNGATSYTWNNIPTGTYFVGIADSNGTRAQVGIFMCPQDPALQCAYTQYAFPEIFTPNGDGVNDVWVWEGKRNGIWEVLNPICFPNSSWNIYDRNGVTKYAGTNTTYVPWNGKINNTGPDVPDAGYYYNLSLGNGVTKQGFVVVQR